ncbi:CCDC86 [Branchiostoma lanceolatum]|uniref:Coiled-coil domain-containing protein 86 n=1 Tax=Branchiostoma lanceolatum TaxID=7740 RepID=A0A8J9ZUD1_BRALA|nr:CCDC86 [Branchiostoma lanceolatum]
MEVQLDRNDQDSLGESEDHGTARKTQDPRPNRGSVGGVPAQTYEAVDGTTVVIPRGKPKSGKFWKTVRSERHTSIKKDKPLRTTWNKKMQQRAERKSIKSFEKELKELKQKQLEEKRKRQEEHKKQKLENERKSEIVQPIKNTAKIKRMKKKQLRQIQKRDTGNIGRVVNEVK